MKGRTLCALIAAVALLGCSAPDEEVLAAGMRTAIDGRLQVPTLLRTLPWVDEFRLTARQCEHVVSAAQKNRFSPGEAINLSMRVNDAPRGTVVTTYWYGPGNAKLGYEKRPISPGQERLRFSRDDTDAWQQGAYRAEVWIGDIKLQESHFAVVAVASVGALPATIRRLRAT
jgi:hypothetical protein